MPTIAFHIEMEPIMAKLHQMGRSCINISHRSRSEGIHRLFVGISAEFVRRALHAPDACPGDRLSADQDCPVLPDETNASASP